MERNNQVLKRTILTFQAICITIELLAQPKGRDIILDFFEKHPERTSIVLYRNDSLIVKRNAPKPIPLASTAKIMIAIEYAVQAAAGRINSETPVPIAEIEKFYVPNTDAGAYPAWLNHVKNKISDGHIRLSEVAKGMLSFSSNANTEWLLDKVGIENVNARIRALGMTSHTPLYYFVSAMFIGLDLFAREPEILRVKKLREMTMEDYASHASRIHQKLLTDTSYKRRLVNLSIEEQKVFTEKFPAAGMEDYLNLMRHLNGKKYFDTLTQRYLDEVIEFLMDNPKNKSWLKHAGMKGGSTLYVVTKAMYATDANGNTTEMCYGFYPIGWPENEVLPRALNDFDIAILKDGAFREQLKLKVASD
jgi:D-alanyl-D-alanine carboxypeptidase